MLLAGRGGGKLHEVRAHPINWMMGCCARRWGFARYRPTPVCLVERTFDASISTATFRFSPFKSLLLHSIFNPRPSNILFPSWSPFSFLLSRRTLLFVDIENSEQTFRANSSKRLACTASRRLRYNSFPAFSVVILWPVSSAWVPLGRRLVLRRRFACTCWKPNNTLPSIAWQLGHRSAARGAYNRSG